MTSETTLRERKKQETRAQIQRAARTLITECGYEKTTMRSLARAAGVGLGTISLHFKDKKSLLLSTFYEDIGEVTFSAIESVPQNDSLKEQLLSILRALYAYYGEHTIFLRSVVKEALFATGEWKERFDAQMIEVVRRVSALIDTHKETGAVDPTVLSQDVALVCWSIYLNGLVDGLNAEEFDAATQVAKVETLLDVVLNGVLA